MNPKFRALHPHFVAEVTSIDLRRAHDPETLAGIRAGMDQYAVLIFHDQPFTDAEQLAFARRLDGELHTRTGSRAIGKNRLGDQALSATSHHGATGETMQSHT